MEWADFANEIIKDPYEYPTNDSNLWLNLLMKAKQRDIYLFSILVYLRNIGASLVKNDKFGYVIKPIIDSGGQKGWLTQKQYDTEKRYLAPYTKTLTEILKTL